MFGAAVSRPTSSYRRAPNKAQHDLVKAFAEVPTSVRRACVSPSRRRVVVASVRDRLLSDFVEALGLGDAVEIAGPVSAGVLTVAAFAPNPPTST